MFMVVVVVGSVVVTGDVASIAVGSVAVVVFASILVDVLIVVVSDVDVAVVAILVGGSENLRISRLSSIVSVHLLLC